MKSCLVTLYFCAYAMNYSVYKQVDMNYDSYNKQIMHVSRQVFQNILMLLKISGGIDRHKIPVTRLCFCFIHIYFQQQPVYVAEREKQFCCCHMMHLEDFILKIPLRTRIKNSNCPVLPYIDQGQKFTHMQTELLSLYLYSIQINFPRLYYQVFLE